MKYTLPELDFAYDALEPHIDTRTMEVHHSKHHQGYINKANAILEKYPDISEMTLEEIFADIDNINIEETDKQNLINNGGGVINHNLFWKTISPNNSQDEDLISDIEKSYGSVEDFKKAFVDIANSHFGSGWAWLVRDKEGLLQVYSLPNQESPYLLGHEPILNLDLWEHSYYLKYQNKRPEYIENFWKVVKMI